MSLPLTLVIALNTCAVWLLLSGRSISSLRALFAGLRRTGPYFRCRMTAAREASLRKLTRYVIARLGASLFYLALAGLLFLPSVVAAFRWSEPAAAFYSADALAGLLLGLIAVALTARIRGI